MSTIFRKTLICLIAVFAVGAVASASASATCYKVAVAGTGHWENSTCTTVGTTKAYVEVEKLETPLGAGEWCAKVKPTEPSTYKNNTCTEANTGTGEFTKVLNNRVWTVKGATLATGVPKAFTITKSGSFVLTAGTEKITCTEQVVEGGEIENVLVETKGPTGRDKGTTRFKKCTASKAGCTVTEPIVVKGTTILAETTGTPAKIVDVFLPEAGKELTPAEITKFEGEKAGKATTEQEKLHPYTKIEQTGTGCVAATTVEGDGVAGEFPVEGEATSHVLNFPVTAITPVRLWNGLTITLKLKAFGVAAKEVGSLTIALTTGEAFGVQ